MNSIFKIAFLFTYSFLKVNCFHEQYRVPTSCSKNWESYVYNDKEYLVHNLPVNWENAKILCRGQHNGSLAILDTKEKATFMAEALSESELLIEALWVGARRASSDDPAGYRWSHGLELRRTAADIVSENDKEFERHFPMWVNRTHIPVPEGGADCVALQRVSHDKPVFLDLPCHLERPFACQKEPHREVKVTELKTVRCRTGLYRVYDGRLDWHQAAAHCVLHKMTLANIGTMRCLKKLGMTMLKSRPSIENAWVGARGSLGKWWWVDTGIDIFQPAPYIDTTPGTWPPMRDRSSIKQDGCLQLDRHSTHPPVFMEARCERKMQFICYETAPALRTSSTLPSDDAYLYVLVRQLLDWQQAYDNCLKMKGYLANVDTNDILIQLLLVMSENKDESVSHIWLSGRLNSSHDVSTDNLALTWSNPLTKKKIPDSKSTGDMAVFIPPWLDEEFSSMESPCLNLDRQDHLKPLVYGMPCEVPQASICMIDKSPPKTPAAIASVSSTTDNNTLAGYVDNL